VYIFLGTQWLDALSRGRFPGWIEHKFDWSIIVEIILSNVCSKMQLILSFQILHMIYRGCVSQYMIDFNSKLWYNIVSLSYNHVTEAIDFWAAIPH
jgi:hypothetical protein